ncbi:fibrinogen beta chain-like [Littorina saxatilis]|uniref:fibrinogen beta chain-like n=1 Tax=Littorina saxatilis TaxID=31220 RepID=UPI0038B53D73
MHLTVRMMLASMLLLIPTLRSDAQEIDLTSRHDSYVRCPTASNTIGQGSDIFTGRSEFQCVARCSQSEDCSGVTVCPEGEPDTVTCEMRNDMSLGQCLPYPAQCHLITKDTKKTPELECEQGGVVQGNTCVCPSPYVGPTCQRYMRDCREGQEAGHSMAEGVYSIQPQGVSTPFKVKCDGAVTYVFSRVASSTAVPWSSMSWNDAKHGLGDDLSVLNAASNPENFFIGLIKLRQIVSQAEYNTHIFFSYDGWSKLGMPNYNNFTLGPESSDFQLSYRDFNIYNGNAADNGLNANNPIVFCTTDHDTNGCAGTKDAPGWYGTGCKGYSVFADPPSWPVGGIVQQTNIFIIDLQRHSDFYDD